MYFLPPRDICINLGELLAPLPKSGDKCETLCPRGFSTWSSAARSPTFTRWVHKKRRWGFVLCCCVWRHVLKHFWGDLLKSLFKKKTHRSLQEHIRTLISWKKHWFNELRQRLGATFDRLLCIYSYKNAHPEPSQTENGSRLNMTMNCSSSLEACNAPAVQIEASY